MKDTTFNGNQEYIIRSYSSDDYFAVRALLQAAGMFDKVRDSKESLRVMTSQNPNAVLVVTINEAVVASVYVHLVGHWCYLWRLVTASLHRQQGIATKLLEFVEQILRDQGVPEAAIFVNEQNEELKDFYAKRGWQLGNVYRSMWKVL